ADVRAVLAPLADHSDVAVALPARRAIGRVDEPGTIDMVRRLLVDDDDDIDADEELALVLDAMNDTSVAFLKDALLEGYEKRADHNRHSASALLLPLVRAGLTEIPEGVLDAAREEQQM